MKVIGNISQIKNTRNSQLQDIEVYVDQISYITHKKDGRFYQSFEYVDTLDSPLIITGDCLSLAPNPDFEEEDFNFYVFDKTGDVYTMNENKRLILTLVYAEEAEQIILNTGTYTVTVPNEEFEQIRKERSKNKKLYQGKNKKKN